jgi:hypothetical protein
MVLGKGFREYAHHGRKLQPVTSLMSPVTATSKGETREPSAQALGPCSMSSLVV